MRSAWGQMCFPVPNMLNVFKCFQHCRWISSFLGIICSWKLSQLKQSVASAISLQKTYTTKNIHPYIQYSGLKWNYKQITVCKSRLLFPHHSFHLNVRMLPESSGGSASISPAIFSNVSVAGALLLESHSWYLTHVLSKSSMKPFSWELLKWIGDIIISETESRPCAEGHFGVPSSLE